MPYKTNKNLPIKVREKLPTRIQTVFRKAFNNAHKQHGVEDIAFKVAWATVRKAKKKK